MGRHEEKRKDLREELKDSVIPATTLVGGPQAIDVDLRKGRPKEEKWSYLIALLIPVLILVIVLVMALIFS